jgi:hypothetical protein
VYRAIRDLRIAMSNKAIKRKAAEHLGNGLPKQYAYDLLLAEYPEAKPKKVAEVLRYMPSQQAQERYRTVHLLLLGIIIAVAVLRVAKPMMVPGFQWEASFKVLDLLPFATLFLAWSIWRWEGHVFEWVGWLNVIGAYDLVKMLSVFPHGRGEPWNTGMTALTVGIGVLALYLARRVFAKPKEEQDPLGQGPKRYVFPEDGMV